MSHRLVLAFAFACVVAACNTSSASAAPTAAPSASASASASAGASTRGATVKGLRAEIVPVIGGLFPARAADPDGKPVTVPWTLRITNTTDAPIVFRTGGDDESFDIEVRGPGAASVATKELCNELWAFGKKNVIPAKGHLDVPVVRLASGQHCKRTAHYLTAPGLYAIDISLNGHIHDASAPPARGERGVPVRLEAKTINVRAS